MALGHSDACVEERACMHISAAGRVGQTVTMIHEQPVEIRLNGTAVVRTQCLAADLNYMAAGFLLCEGLVSERAEITGIDEDAGCGVIDVAADIPAERCEGIGKHIRVAAGGGRMAVIDKMEQQSRDRFHLASAFTMPRQRLLEIGKHFNSIAGLYRPSKFVHSAALSDGFDILIHCEDVGRHNAVDKVIGYGLLNGLSFDRLVLLCSGRFSLEMVAKAARAGLPLYVSPAAASIEGMEYAERIGMTLCGRIGDASAVVYSNPWRITE